MKTTAIVMVALLVLLPAITSNVKSYSIPNNPEPMVFPTVTANGAIHQASGTQTVPWPVGVENGDLLILFESNYGATGEFYTCSAFSPGTWRTMQIAGSERLFGCSKIAAVAGETGVTYNKVATNTLTFQTYRVTNWFGVNDNTGMSFIGADMASPPNPPSHNPTGWDIEDTLWLVIGSLDATGAETISGPPSGYTNLRYDESVDEAVRSGFLESATASQDPGTFTTTGGVVGAAAFTVAVRPSIFSPPVVETLPADAIGVRTARLNGDLTDAGDSVSVEVHFEWGTTVALGTSTIPETLITEGTFDFELTGLAPNTQYFFQAHAENEAGTASGAILNFTTDPDPNVVNFTNYFWLIVFSFLVFVMLWGAWRIKRWRD